MKRMGNEYISHKQRIHSTLMIITCTLKSSMANFFVTENVLMRGYAGRLSSAKEDTDSCCQLGR